jgi:hypothetical protein
MNVIANQAAKVSGSLFVVLVLFIIGIVYYPYVFLVWGPDITGKPVANTQKTTAASWCSCYFITLWCCWCGRSFKRS